MPLEAKPLFRPDVLRTHLGAFASPDRVEAAAPKLRHWAELFASRRADSFKEQELLPDFLTDFFCGLLGYTRPADGQPRYTLSREKHVEVDGKFADAVLGNWPTTRHTSSGSCFCWVRSGWCRRPGDAISTRSGMNRRKWAAS